MELRRESSMASSHREQLEEEARASKEESVKLKGAMMEMAEQVDESAREREEVIQCVREEKHELREENAQLHIQMEELRLELSVARGMLVILEDSSNEFAAEAQRLRGENAELGQECAKLKFTLPTLQSELSEAEASLQAAAESAAKAEASLQAAEESAAKAEEEVAALRAMQEAGQLSLPPAFRGVCGRAEEAGMARQWTEEMCRAAVAPMSRCTGRQRAVSLSDSFAEPRRERTSSGVELKHARTFEETSKEEEGKMERLLCEVRKSLSSAAPLTKAENELIEVENELMKVLRQRFQKVEIRREVQDRGDARV
uniref:Uncharacterized protein n=1 Tax=Alexandrium catenella TaxID=2925 RepID=A0A7S1QWP7_ALECA|mmetsp:Transcript_40117/g.108352  ORF Transcript_40117/g.108352 Transcript_40117/m.108352 type:complete len:315 (+) Transcript_40117:2-946(+)